MPPGLVAKLQHLPPHAKKSKFSLVKRHLKILNDGVMIVNKRILKLPKQNSPKLDSSYKVKGLNKYEESYMHLQWNTYQY